LRATSARPERLLDARYECSPDGDVGNGTVSSQDVLQSVQGAVHVNLRVWVLAENHKMFPFLFLAAGNYGKNLE
jgi:hypothetical protein